MCRLTTVPDALGVLLVFAIVTQLPFLQYQLDLPQPLMSVKLKTPAVNH